MARQSPKMKQAIRLWQSLQDEKQNRIQRQRGILGNGTGIVRVPDRPDLVYMRLNADSTRVWKVVNDQVADTDGLPVIAEKHPDTDFWEVIDVDKEALISSGTGFTGIPYRKTHGETHEWPDGSPGIDAVNVYRRSLVDLRTEPVYENYSLNVYVRPLVYSYQGTIKRYKGTQPYLSLSSYVPQTGIRSILTYLDIRTNYFWASPGPPTSYYVGNTPTEPNVPWYAKPSALVTLRESQNIITEADIEDIRDVIDDEGIHHNLTASRAPTINDDALSGYSEGSFWLFGTTLYACSNPAIGAAVWGQVNGGGNAWPLDDQLLDEDATEYANILALITALNTGGKSNGYLGPGFFTYSSADISWFNGNTALVGVTRRRSRIEFDAGHSLLLGAGVEIKALGISSTGGSGDTGCIEIGNNVSSVFLKLLYLTTTAPSGNDAYALKVGTNNIGHHFIDLECLASASGGGTAYALYIDTGCSAIIVEGGYYQGDVTIAGASGVSLLGPIITGTVSFSSATNGWYIDSSDDLHFVKGGSDIAVIDSDGITLPESGDDIYIAGDEAGVKERNTDFGVTSITDHFDNDSFSGWSWSNYGGMITPDNISMTAYPSMVRIYNSSGGKWFAYQSYSSAVPKVRLTAGEQTYIGLRIDDGTDSNYVEISILLSGGVYNIYTTKSVSGVVTGPTLRATGVPAGFYILGFSRSGDNVQSLYTLNSLALTRLAGETVTSFSPANTGFFGSHNSGSPNVAHAGVFDWIFK
jgi:hypothetical protein